MTTIISLNISGALILSKPSTVIIDKKVPSEKNVVTLLCKYVREDSREVISKNDKSTKQYTVYACPSKDKYINKSGEIEFQKSTGFTNPCNHFKSCIAHGNLNKLHQITFIQNVTGS